MTIEDVLSNLLEELQEIADPGPLHKENCPGDECYGCHLMRMVAAVVDEAENDLTRIKLGIAA